MKKSFSTLVIMFMSLALYAQEQKITISSPEFKEYNDGRHKGLDFSIKTGFMVGVGDAKGADMIPVDLSLGKQFSEKLYFGLSSGVWIPKGSDGDVNIPIALDAKVMFPSETSTTKFNLGMRLGYLASSNSKVSGSILGELMPGIQLPISKKMDFLISAGYAHAFSMESNGGSAGYFAVKAGINIHKNPFYVKKGPRREKVPTREKGLQFTLEGGFNPSPYDGAEFAGNLVCTYKLNHYLSVGGGVGYERTNPFYRDFDSDNAQISDYDIQYVVADDNKVSTFGSNLNIRLNSYKFFARGVYRPFKSRISPIASLDLGMRYMQFEDDMFNTSMIDSYGTWYYLDAEQSSFMDKLSSVGFYAQPAIGLSLRTTKNSYLELKGSLLLATKVKGQKARGTTEHYGDIAISMRDKAVNTPCFLSLGFTHTFGKRGKRLR